MKRQASFGPATRPFRLKPHRCLDRCSSPPRTWMCALDFALHGPTMAPGWTHCPSRSRPLRHCRQCFAAFRWRERLRSDGGHLSRAPGPAAAGSLSQPGGGWLASRTRWASSRLRRASAARALRPEGAEHRPLELNEAFASQALYWQQRLGIPDERLNVDGGATSIGHAFGMTGPRLAGHALLESQRRRAAAQKVRWGVVTMCIAGGMGAAGLFKIF